MQNPLAGKPAGGLIWECPDAETDVSIPDSEVNPSSADSAALTTT